MQNAKCGDVLLFHTMNDYLLAVLENIYNEPIPEHPLEAAHTLAIYLTMKSVRTYLIQTHYFLIWKPFFGFRWIEVEDLNSIYSRLRTKIDFDSREDLNFDLGLGELEIKQKDFNKWRGEEKTKKLVDFLSRPEITRKFQELLQEISEGIPAGKYEPANAMKRIEFQYWKNQPIIK